MSPPGAPAPDFASVYVLPLGADEADREQVIEALNRVAPALRRMLGPMVALKFLPELRFAADTRFERAERIEALLREARAGSTGTVDDGS